MCMNGMPSNVYTLYMKLYMHVHTYVCSVYFGSCRDHNVNT